MDTKEPTCLGDYIFDKDNCICVKKPLTTILEEIDSPSQLKTIFSKPKDYENFVRTLTKIGTKKGKTKTATKRATGSKTSKSKTATRKATATKKATAIKKSKSATKKNSPDNIFKMSKRFLLPSAPKTKSPSKSKRKSKSKSNSKPKKKRCPNGSRKDKKTGRCIKRRCPNGTRKNPKTKKCESY